MPNRQADNGVPLTHRVLDRVRSDPSASALSYRDVPWVIGEPTPLEPAASAQLTFPSGRPLSPSLRTWLAYDTGLLDRHGWFDDDGGLTPRPLLDLVDQEMGSMWASLFEPIADRFGECFLLPGGSDSRRVLAVGEPDTIGEYPVLALDVDDMPFIGLMYPGFDVYLAHTIGLIEREFDTYTALADDPAYSGRMHEHARAWFDGRIHLEYPFENN